ncbi:MAG: type II toxin-antitoxin system VapC family toxin [Anaerolineaceae bacterium]|nr:type II toxin-antitoxin system VapC family toxin [Anaerolineaceae bacterium]
MNVVDSSGWLEYLSDGANAAFFAPAIEDTEQLIVPVICIYEVFKRVMQQVGESAAVVSIGDMYQGQIIDLTAPIAIQAAKYSAERELAMADSIILAISRAYNATLWTQDSDFEGIDGVAYIAKGT